MPGEFYPPKIKVEVVVEAVAEVEVVEPASDAEAQVASEALSVFCRNVLRMWLAYYSN